MIYSDRITIFFKIFLSCTVQLNAYYNDRGQYMPNESICYIERATQLVVSMNMLLKYL